MSLDRADGADVLKGAELGQAVEGRLDDRGGILGAEGLGEDVAEADDLEAAEGAKLGPAELAAQSLVRSADGLLKVLGNGEITRAVTVTAHAVSASAKAKIEKAGGKVVLLGGEAKPE